MLDIDAATQASLDSGRIYDRALLLFMLPSGNYGFWSGTGPYTYNANTYVGAGRLLTATLSTEEVSDGTARELSIELSSIPNSGLTPDVLATIEQQSYKGRPVRLYQAFFDADTRQLLSVITRFAGSIDEIPHEYVVGGKYTLTANCVSRAIDHQKTGHQLRSTDSQKLIDATDDGSFDRAATAGTEFINWGQAPSEATD
jgi:hypothetical protein